jgi:hypothetical protein
MTAGVAVPIESPQVPGSFVLNADAQATDAQCAACLA